MILSLDIGGTKTAVGLVAKTGTIQKAWSYPTKADKGSRLFLDSIMQLIETHQTAQVDRIGIGIAGQVDAVRGIYLKGPNLPLKNAPLAKLIQQSFKVPVALHNDAQCFAYAEALRGAGRKYPSVFGMTIGTGIGGGFVLGGQLMQGATGTLGEVGHMTINIMVAKKSPRCACGQYNHLEAYAGGASISARYKALTGKQVSPIEIETLLQKKNFYAEKIVFDAQTALAAGFNNIRVSLNPNVIVVGGGLAKFRELWQPARRLANELCPFAALRKTPIVPGILKENAGLIGAALLTNRF
ncbi:MAG: ROK family protein [bacterium]|nr:ROK family protein [bacterium]